MEIIVNGTLAVLKAGSSFQYVSENRAFTEAEGYSLSISFPMKDCQRNIQIFGHLYRPDVRTANSTFDCEIRDKSFVKYGSLTLIDISPEEIKAQFLEGKSAANNFVDFNDTYINRLNLGKPADTTPPTLAYSAWNDLSKGYVALPWYNSSNGTMENEVVPDEQGNWKWADGITSLSFFPYLIFIAKRICEAMDFSYDFSEWESSDILNRILLCNTLPAAWDLGFAEALPELSVSEFFSAIEPILQGEFLINSKAKMITFMPLSMIRLGNPIEVLSNVIDEYSVSLNDDTLEIVDLCTVKYKDRSDDAWKFLSCEWLFDTENNVIVKYATLEALISSNIQYKEPSNLVLNNPENPIHRILYAIDVDTYFVIRNISNTTQNYCVLQPVNIFAPYKMSEAAAAEKEILMSPAWTDFIDQYAGACLHLDIQGNPAESSAADHSQPIPVQRLIQGEKNEADEYLSNLYFGFWNGGGPTADTLPCPIVDGVTVTKNWVYLPQQFISYRLKNVQRVYPGVSIDGAQKFIFSFLSKDIPNVRSIFLINNQRFICKKITATFTENGLLELMKGEFYAIS